MMTAPRMARLAILVISCGIFGWNVSAAPHRPADLKIAKAPLKKTNQYLADGVFVGGKSGNIQTLLGIRKTFFAKDGVERIVFDFGDRNGKSFLRENSYFHIQNDAKNSRIVIDLSEIFASKLNVAQIKNQFFNSKFVRSAEVTHNPQDSTMTLVLTLKGPVELETFQRKFKKQGSKVVLDLRSIEGSKRSNKKQIKSQAPAGKRV